MTLSKGEPVAPTGVGETDHLTPAPTRAIPRAIAAPGAEGVALSLTSGWRSEVHQQSLYEAAVRTYGTAGKASEWVLPLGRSAHVRGKAVDDNEYWHFELLAAAKGSACPTREAHA